MEMEKDTGFENNAKDEGFSFKGFDRSVTYLTTTTSFNIEG